MKPALKFLAFALLAGAFVYVSCKKEYSCEGCGEKNKPPIAVAGPDLVITLPTDSASLDGRSSSDPDGSITAYKWTKISGPASLNMINTTSALTVTKNLIVGLYTFELKVTDNGGLSAKDTMRIIVDSVLRTNHPPNANAGTDLTMILPTNTVILDGSGSTDPENNIISYVWAKITGPVSFTIANSNTIQTQVTNLVQGIYQFELKVTDASGLFSKDTMRVMVNAFNPNNLPPIAVAGNDTTIQTNQNPCNTPVPLTITLNGTNSFDPDGTIVSYLWTGNGDIANPTTAITQVSNLLPGNYAFILKVTDNSGAIDNDTIQICIVGNRPLVNAQLIPISTLSQTREGIAVASVGNKILFAGGYTGSYTSGFQYYTRVDIFDISTNLWTTAELSEPRTAMGTAVLGNKIFFAGGNWSTSIDIYDAAANTWSTAALSIGRSYIAAASAGDKVLFAAGIGQGFFSPHWPAPPLDIYNASTNTWLSGILPDRPTNNSIGEAGIAATTIGNKIYFAGNASDWFAWDFGTITSTINIYDVSNNSWSTSNLSIPRGFMASIAVGNKNYWAGGLYAQPPSLFFNLVEIRDAITGVSTFNCLFQPNAFFSAVLKNNKIVFFTSDIDGSIGGSANSVNNKFDIYDINTNTWSIGVLPVNIYGSSIISVN